MTLPPLPTLDRRHVRAETAQVSGFGELQALVPAAAPYVCADPRAPAMLLVPGLGLDGLGMIRQLPLGALTHLHLFQMPNTPAANEIGLGWFARHVEEYILAKKLDRQPGGLILGGNSMGGAVSLLIASRGRVALRGLVLIGTYGSCKHLPAYQRALAPLAYVIPMAMIRRVVWRTIGKAGLHQTTAEEGRWMASPILRRTHGYYGRAVSALTRIELLEGARAIAAPTLVVHGSDDPVLPLAAGRELAQTISGAAFAQIDGARHSLHFTNAEAVNAAVAAFLRDRNLCAALPA